MEGNVPPDMPSTEEEEEEDPTANLAAELSRLALGIDTLFVSEAGSSSASSSSAPSSSTRGFHQPFSTKPNAGRRNHALPAGQETNVGVLSVTPRSRKSMERNVNDGCDGSCNRRDVENGKGNPTVPMQILAVDRRLTSPAKRTTYTRETSFPPISIKETNEKIPPENLEKKSTKRKDDGGRRGKGMKVGHLLDLREMFKDLLTSSGKEKIRRRAASLKEVKILLKSISEAAKILRSRKRRRREGAGDPAPDHIAEPAVDILAALVDMLTRLRGYVMSDDDMDQDRNMD